MEVELVFLQKFGSRANIDKFTKEAAMLTSLYWANAR